MRYLETLSFVCLAGSVLIAQINIYRLDNALDLLKQEVTALKQESKDLTKITKE